MTTNSYRQWLSRDRITVLALVLAAAVTLTVQAAGAVAYLERAAAFIQFPATEDYGEGPILYQTAALRDGESMYTPIDEPPYAVSNYPPVFHLATLLMTAFTDDLLAAGRLVSFLSALGCSLLIFTLVYRTSGREHSRAVRGFGGALAALFFLSHYSITLWSVMARVDTLALALGLLGMQVSELSVRHRSRSLAGLFGLIFVLAAFTKQNMIAAAIAAFATAFIFDRRLAYAALAASLPAGLIGLAVLHVTSGGQFLLHAFLYNLNEFKWNELGQQAMTFVSLNPAEVLLLLFGPVYLFASWRRHKAAARAGRPATPDLPLILFAGFMAASLLNVVSSVKEGAAANYYIEFQAAGALLLGMTAMRVTSFLQARRMDPDYAKYGLIVLLGLFLVGWQGVFGWEVKYRRPYQVIVPNMERVIELAASVDGPVISEDMVLLYRTGKPLYYQPFIMTRLAVEGRWDATPMLDRLRRGEVPMIILTTEIGSGIYRDRFLPAFTEALQTRYRLLDRFGHYAVYVPS